MNLTYKGRPRKRYTRATKLGRPFRDTPTDYEKLVKIVYWREVEGWQWRRIGDELGTTHMAPYKLYKKWRHTIKEE